jgi:O-antigen/teichoic acid export membrane protein
VANGHEVSGGLTDEAMESGLPTANGAHGARRNDTVPSKSVRRYFRMRVPGSRPRSLRRNFGSATIGNVVYTASQFGMVSALAKLTSPAEVGRYALAFAIAGPVFMFTGLKLRQVQVTDAGGDFTFSQYLGLRILTSTLASVTVPLVAWLWGTPKPALMILVGVSAFKGFESVIDISYGAMQQREEFQLVAVSMAWRGLIGLVAFGVTLALTHEAAAAVAALAAVTLVQVGTNVVRVRSLGITALPRFDCKVLMRLAKLAFPLGVAVALGSLTVNVPRYFLQASQDSAAVGIFSAVSYSLVATATIAASLGEAASPRLANLYYLRDAEAFVVTVRKLVLAGATLGLAGVITATVMGEPFLRVAFGPEYADQKSLLIVLMVAAMVQYSAVFLGTAVNALRMFAVQAPVNLATLVAVVLAASLAVPQWGLIGAAVAVGTGQTLQAVWYAVLTWRVVLPRVRQS